MCACVCIIGLWRAGPLYRSLRAPPEPAEEEVNPRRETKSDRTTPKQPADDGPDLSQLFRVHRIVLTQFLVFILECPLAILLVLAAILAPWRYRHVYTQSVELCPDTPRADLSRFPENLYKVRVRVRVNVSFKGHRHRHTSTNTHPHIRTRIYAHTCAHTHHKHIHTYTHRVSIPLS